MKKKIKLGRKIKSETEKEVKSVEKEYEESPTCVLELKKKFQGNSGD